MLTEIRVPDLPTRTGSVFVEMARRAGDYALVGVAALITFERPRSAYLGRRA